jgi:hypothetical protein
MAYQPLKNPTTFIIKKQVIRVEKLIIQRNKFNSIAFNQKIKLQQLGRREKAEKKLETKGTEKLISNKIQTPRLGFLDTIKNFLFSVLFGALTLKLLPHLPKLKGLLITTLKIGNFGIEFAETILNAMATFIDKAYQIIDFGKQQAKILGGDTGVKNYEKTLGIANKVMNGMFIAGMLFSDLIVLKAQTDSNQSTLNEIGQEVTEQVVKRQGFRDALKSVASRIANVAGRANPILLVGTASAILGELTFQQRKFTQNLEKQVTDKLKEAQEDKNPITKAFKLLAYATAIPGLKFYNFVSTAIGSLLDIIGAPFKYLGELINFGIMSLTGDAKGIQTQRENLSKFDARVREQFRQLTNTLSFGLLAKEKGSWGNIYGDDAAQKGMMNKMYGGGSVKSFGYAEGGSVTRGGEFVGGAIGRTGVKKAIARTIEIPVSPLNPGADIGGSTPYMNPTTGKPTGTSNIETFFPNPEDSKYVSPFRYLTKSYGVASTGNFIKPFLQVPIKMIMGDGSAFSNSVALAAAVNNLFNNILSNIFVSGTKETLADKIGAVDILSWAARTIQETMMAPLEELKSALISQFGLRSGVSGAPVSPSAQKGEGVGTNPLAEFAGQAQFVIGDSIAHGFAGRSGNGDNNSDTQVGRSPTKILEILKAKGDALKGMLIDLSTGIVNSPGDFTSIEEQLSYLKSIGARVRVLGVANSFSEKNGNLNQKLDQMIKKYGFYFYGGYKGASDGVHGTVTDYNDLKEKIIRDTAPIETSMPQGNINDLVSGTNAFMQVGFPLKGAAYLSGNVQQESGWKGQRTPWVLNDGAGINKGLVSWNRGRITNAEKYLGKPLNSASNAEQIKWIKHEMQTSYKEAYNIFMNQNASDAELQRASYIYLGYGDVGARYSYAKQALKALSVPQALHGGYIDKTQNVLTHPGEYVIDADSVKLFGINFYDIINQTETISQRQRASQSLMSILSQYTEDGFPETEDDYTYNVPQRQIVMLPPQVIHIGSGGDIFMSNNEGDDPSYDSTERY